MSEECRDCGRTDGGCDRVRDQSFERATWQDDRVCDHPCLMKHTRYVDTGEVADPGGCYWVKPTSSTDRYPHRQAKEQDTIRAVSSDYAAEMEFRPNREETVIQRAQQHIADEWGLDEPDPVNPSHYELPGGEQVSWISRYLTSNGGQAVQYIARSTRLDGNNKSSDIADRIEDLKKSIWFLEDEISRLEEEGA